MIEILVVSGAVMLLGSLTIFSVAWIGGMRRERVQEREYAKIVEEVWVNPPSPSTPEKNQLQF